MGLQERVFGSEAVVLGLQVYYWWGGREGCAGFGESGCGG